MDGVGHTYTLSANDDIFYGTFVLNLMLNLPIVQQWELDTQDSLIRL